MSNEIGSIEEERLEDVPIHMTLHALPVFAGTTKKNDAKLHQASVTG
ncbi:MAG: hypothetical protein J0H87_01380 [Holosporales bacterium]|nr:hypothetical protein [Holosporales bacterium]